MVIEVYCKIYKKTTILNVFWKKSLIRLHLFDTYNLFENTEKTVI